MPIINLIDQRSHWS